jgi:hypothetical protein
VELGQFDPWRGSFYRGIMFGLAQSQVGHLPCGMATAFIAVASLALRTILWKLSAIVLP